jgi:hypothetical protein
VIVDEKRKNASFTFFFFPNQFGGHKHVQVLFFRDIQSLEAASYIHVQEAKGTVGGSSAL